MSGRLHGLPGSTPRQISISFGFKSRSEKSELYVSTFEGCLWRLTYRLDKGGRKTPIFQKYVIYTHTHTHNIVIFIIVEVFVTRMICILIRYLSLHKISEFALY